MSKTRPDTIAKYRAAIKRAAVLASSTRKAEVLRGFRELECLAKGSCVKNAGWDESFVYEFVRCHIPTRVMQYLKQRHHGTQRWTSYAKGAYASLFRALYDDLSPDTDVYGNGEDELVVCSNSQWDEWLLKRYGGK